MANEEVVEKKKKPIYKKWWFWVIVVLIVAAAGGSPETDDTKTNPANQGSSVKTETVKTDSKKEEDKEPEEAVEEADKDALNATIKQYDGTTSEGWTESSYKVFAAAMKEAKRLAGDQKATQDEVDDAQDALLKSYGALEKEFNADNYSWPKYSKVARKPDSYEGKQIAFSGKVIQVVESNTETQLRVATDGGYEDIILVAYDPAILDGTRVLEDDSITVYGTCLGQISYTSGMGVQISIPGLLADRVIIN